MIQASASFDAKKQNRARVLRMARKIPGSRLLLHAALRGDRRAILFTLFLVPALLSSCVLYRGDTNEALSPKAIAGLQVGSTSAQQALDLLGAPNDVVQIGRGSAWYYEHTTSKTAGFWALLLVLSATDTRTDRLWLFFDEAGTLRHAGSTLAAGRTGFSLPWSDVHSNVPHRQPDQQTDDR